MTNDEIATKLASLGRREHAKLRDLAIRFPEDATIGALQVIAKERCDLLTEAVHRAAALNIVSVPIHTSAVVPKDQ